MNKPKTDEHEVPRLGGVPVPLPIPSVVKDGLLITALSAVVLTFPLMALFGYGGGVILSWVGRLVGVKLAAPLVVVFMVSGMTAIGPPLLIGFSRTSSFILECVKWYLEREDQESAQRLVLAVGYQVWYREWKRNPWFRRFAAESGILGESDRLREFNRKLPAG